MEIYKSKMSKGFFIALVLLFIYLGYMMITESDGFWISLFCLLLYVLFFYNILSLRYIINNKVLEVKAKIFYHKKLRLNRLERLKKPIR